MSHNNPEASASVLDRDDTYCLHIRVLQTLDRIAEGLRDQCERRKVWLLGAFSAMYLLAACLLASRRLLWNDELYTLYIARLPSFSEIWSALSTGADQIPPSFHLITRASFSLFGLSHIPIRLPQVIGFWVMTLCLFHFVSKRSSALYGFVAMLFPLVTFAYDYAAEARPYGLVLGFSALALVCWQAAAEGQFRKGALIGLALSVAAAVSSHYYGILILFPLALGETVRSLGQRRFDLGVWVAFACCTVPLLLFLPLIERASAYAAHFWSPPDWKLIPSFYYFLLPPSVVPLLATLSLSAVYFTSRSVAITRPNQESRLAPPFHEIAAAVGFIAIPVIGIIFAKLVTGAFTHRHALPAVIGFSILVSFAAYRLLDGRAIIGAALVLFSCVWFMALEVKYLQQANEASIENAKAYRLLQTESERSLPIVVADALTFMKLAHYAPEDIAPRLLYLADPAASLRYLGHNTVDRGMLDLERWFHLNVEEYLPYIASQRRFLVYARIRDDRGQIWDFNWLLSELTSSGMRVELRGRSGESLLFLVSAKY